MDLPLEEELATNIMTFTTQKDISISITKHTPLMKLTENSFGLSFFSQDDSMPSTNGSFHRELSSPSSSMAYGAEVSKQPHTQFGETSPHHGGLFSPSDSQAAAAEVTLSSSASSHEPHTESEVTYHQPGELSGRQPTGAEVTLSSSAHLEEQVNIFLRRYSKILRSWS